jgi:hypothetical protein
MDRTSNHRSWLVIDRKEPSADSSFFFPGTLLRGVPLPSGASPDDVAYLVSHRPELGFRLRGWALVREVETVADDRERRTVLQFDGRIREPVPLVGLTATLREILESRGRDAREFECLPGPLEVDDIAYLDKIVESHGMPLPERPQTTDEEITDVRLSAVLERDLSENVRTILFSAAGLAKPSRVKGTPTPGLDLLSVARALVQFGIENESKAINYPGTTLTPVVFAHWLKARVDPAAFGAEFVDPFEGKRLTAVDPNQVALSAGLKEAIERAGEIAGRVTKKDHISLRHLTATLFLSEGIGPELIRAFWRDRLKVDIREFASEFLRAIETSPRPNEDMAAWRAVLAPVLPTRLADRIRYHTAYGADLSDRDARDSLDITADVEAFAELICLKAAKPPISVGLFGNWGSGKSFFMEKLSQRIEQLTKSEAERTDSPFVGNIVQIRFNAWTYADSDNLWASLTAEFFDQLRAGGYAKTGDARYQEIVNTVRSRVAMAANDLEALKGSASAIASSIEAANKEIATLLQRRKTVVVDAAKESAGQLLSDYIEIHKAALAAACRGLGIDVAEDKLTETLLETSKAAADWFGKLKMIMREVWHRRREARVWIGLGFAAILLFVAAALPAMDFSILREWADSLIAAAGAAISALLVFRPSWILLRPLFTAGDKFREDAAAKRRDIDKQIETLRANLASLESEAKKAADEQATRTAFIARYEAGAQGQSPAALLHFFLHGSDATREYDRHLGLVSRVRRSFEVLNALMPRPEAGGERTAVLHSIDRIVLYIDDLDRCRDAQVVQVLEAVHLLLAFPLFVVVVGVDARWLQHSLAKHYDEQLSAPDKPDPGKATVTDYLEKIFQIPFWLRPLSVAQDGKDGTYERLVDDLVSVARPVPTSGPLPRAIPSPTTAIPQSGLAAHMVSPESANTPLPLRAAAAATTETPLPVRTEVEVRKAVELENEEIKLMKAMGSLVGKSPRAVKRFINLYRLIRARRAGGELEDFLGKRGNDPAYPATMFLLAIDAGLTVAEAESVYTAIDSYIEGIDTDASDSVAEALDIEQREPPIPVPHLENLVRIHPVLNKAVAAVHRAMGGGFRIEHLLSVAPEVRRYSFRQQIRSMSATLAAN